MKLTRTPNACEKTMQNIKETSNLAKHEEICITKCSKSAHRSQNQITQHIKTQAMTMNHEDRLDSYEKHILSQFDGICRLVFVGTGVFIAFRGVGASASVKHGKEVLQ